MRNLVMPGGTRLTLQCVDAAGCNAVKTWLQSEVGAEALDAFMMPSYGLQDACTVIVYEKNILIDTAIFGVRLDAIDVLFKINRSDIKEAILEFSRLPSIIYFNGLGDINVISEMIQQELGAKPVPVGSLVENKITEGVLVAFTKADGANEHEAVNEAMLYLKGDYHVIKDYLQTHAPRYLGKAFPSGAWHMVEIHIKDPTEQYDEQYKRFRDAVAFLDLGYYVFETWNQDYRRFGGEVSAYVIRLLTFQSIMDLKLLLIALEYDALGFRVVNLDLLWHGTKISWLDLIDDRDIRKKVYGEQFQLPSSKFFAARKDKHALVAYANNVAKEKLTPEQLERLRSYGQEI